MKKRNLLLKVQFITLCLMLASNLPSFSKDNFTEKDVSKYTLLQTTFNYTPIRESASDGAKRFTHLKSGIALFAQKHNSEFYKLDLGLDKPYWIEKRYVKVEGTIPEKKVSKISKIKFYESKRNYLVKINTPIQTSYKINQNKNGLQFFVFDVSTNDKKINVKYKDKEDRFDYSIKKVQNSSGILTVNYKNKGPIYGYDVKKTNNGLVFKIRKPVEINDKKPLKGIKIALDPGHGGNEKGVVSGGFAEKDVNLQIANELNKILKEQGAKTILTRKKDVDTGLYKRVDMANKANADFLISIHQNSLANPKNYEKKHGAGVYYYNENAKDLAYTVQKNLVKSTGFKDDGVFNASFAITRATNPVSILVECGYLIHPYERKKLTDKEFQKTVAKAISNGLEEYLLNNTKL